MSELMQKVSAILAEKVEAAIQDGFNTDSQPMGAPWARLKRSTVRKRGSSQFILNDTGIMLASHTVVPTATGVTVHFPSPGGYHQYGTRRMVARPLSIPDDQAEKLIQQSIEEALGDDDILGAVK